MMAVLVVIYLGVSLYGKKHFLPNTMLNDMDISGKSAKQVEQQLEQELKQYRLTVLARNDKKVTIRGKDISLQPEFGDAILELLKEQNSFAWPKAMIKGQKLETDAMVTFDKERLLQEIYEMDIMQPQNQEAPVNAYLSDYISGSGYEIIPESKGTVLVASKVEEAVIQAVETMEDTVSLDEMECYEKPMYTSESTELVTLQDTLNQYVGVTITYDIGDKREVLDGDTIHQWLGISGTEVTIDNEAVAEYTVSLASKYNTAFRQHTLKSYTGEIIEFNEGDYGWKVDKEAEAAQIIADIKAAKSVERELNYAQRAASFGENDYGDSYVEINLTKQHLCVYQNGNRVVESDFVSGNHSLGYDTPTGIYGLTYKERDAVLKGVNSNGTSYASDVKYWMPFCNNVGMHDASWRNTFGGTIYLTNGSHGCINLPESAAAKIFDIVDTNFPVIVYEMPGQELPEAEDPSTAAPKAQQVMDMINGIGQVTLESEPAIAAARATYNGLSETAKAMVGNADLLAAQEAELNRLKMEAGQ